MINVTNMSFSYGRAPIINNLNVQFGLGYVHALVGSNGEGKTTLFKLLSGLLLPKSNQGEICLNDKLINTRSKPFLSNTYFLSDDTYESHLSLKDYVKAYRSFYPTFSQDVMDSLCIAFKIDPSKSLKKQSLGQKKKSMLTFALATQVSYLFLDEPTNGLDIESKAILRNALVKYVNESRSVIVSTHNIREIEGTIDYLTILKNGQIILNANTIDLEEKYYVERSQEPIEDATVIYQEPIIGGVISLNKKPDASYITNQSEKIDLELIYKAACVAPNAFADI